MMHIRPIDLFLYKKTDNDRFYETPPLSSGGFEKTAAELKDVPYERERLVALLQDYNQRIGNDDIAEQSAKKLLDTNVFAFTTGQQPGFMGGPAYTILKAITCVIMAKRYNVPAIFWIASEDHDIDEVGKTFTIDEKGNLKRYRLSIPSNGIPLEDVLMEEHSLAAMQAFKSDLNLQIPLPSTPLYSEAMATLLSTLFKGTGLIFIEPKVLRPLSEPFFRREIDNTDAIQELFRKETVDAPFPKGDETTLFLTNKEGKRERVYKGTVPADLSRLTSSVMSRPILASSVIPTAGTVLGPSELSYFQGLKNYYRFHGLVMPWLVPRLSATFIPKEAASAMQGLDPAEIVKTGDTSLIKASGISGSAVNLLQNLLTPHGKLQERVLNWLYFQSKTQINLIQELIERGNPDDLRHLLIYED